MPEEVLFKTEEATDREAIAEYFRAVAESLSGGQPIVLRSGTEEITVDPPTRPTFEVKVEREGPADGRGEISIEFELEWDENGEDEPLTIE